MATHSEHTQANTGQSTYTRSGTTTLKHRIIEIQPEHARIQIEDRYARRGGLGQDDFFGRFAHDMAQYLAILDDSLAELDLSENEALLVVLALQDLCAERATYREDFRRAIVTEAERGASTRDLQVDSDALLAKLDNLSPGHVVAIMDAAERYAELSDGLSDRERVRAVGLARSPWRPAPLYAL